LDFIHRPYVLQPPIEVSSIDWTQQSKFTWWRGKNHPSKRCGWET
jgi:hypothetical protein